MKQPAFSLNFSDVRLSIGIIKTTPGGRHYLAAIRFLHRSSTRAPNARMACAQNLFSYSCDRSPVADSTFVRKISNARGGFAISGKHTRPNHSHLHSYSRSARYSQGCRLCRTERRSISHLGARGSFDLAGRYMELYGGCQHRAETSRWTSKARHRSDVR